MSTETFKGYRLAAFTDAFARYLSAEASQGHNANETDDEPTKNEMSHAGGRDALKNDDFANKHESCDVVTLSHPDPEDASGPTKRDQPLRLWIADSPRAFDPKGWLK